MASRTNMNQAKNMKRPATASLNRTRTRTRTRKGADAGFLLMDALISIFLIGLIGTMGMVAITNTYKGEDYVQIQRQTLTDIQRAVGFIERDLAQLVARPIRDEFGQAQAALIINENADYPLEFTRAGWPNPVEIKRSELQRVAYRVEEGKLFRAYWLHLDRSQGTEPIEVKLLDGVTALTASVTSAEELDDTTSINNNNNSQTWPVNESGNALDANGLKALPAAIELTFELEEYGDLRRLIVVSN